MKITKRAKSIRRNRETDVKAAGFDSIFEGNLLTKYYEEVVNEC